MTHVADPHDPDTKKGLKFVRGAGFVVPEDYTEVQDVVMRQFDTGATRHSDAGKLDYEGFLSPHVLKRYAEYLDEHRTQADGKLRASDNWQQGIPAEVYMKSALRHFIDWWGVHRNQVEVGGAPITLTRSKFLEDALCALMFNTMGYLYEILKEKASHLPPLPPTPREM